MSDEFKYQLSINIPSGEQFEKGDMLNVRGDNAGEFLNNLLALDTQMAEEVARAAANVKAQYVALKEFGGSVTDHSARGQAQSPQQPAQQAYSQPQGNPSQQYQNGPQQPAQQFQGQQQPAQQYNGNQGGYNQPAQPANDAVPTHAPPHVGPAPQCSHGVKKFIAKAYKNGKPGYWMAWACPAQRGDNSQHELEFISTK